MHCDAETLCLNADGRCGTKWLSVGGPHVVPERPGLAYVIVRTGLIHWWRVVDQEWLVHHGSIHGQGAEVVSPL